MEFFGLLTIANVNAIAFQVSWLLVPLLNYGGVHYDLIWVLVLCVGCHPMFVFWLGIESIPVQTSRWYSLVVMLECLFGLF